MKRRGWTGKLGRRIAGLRVRGGAVRGHAHAVEPKGVKMGRIMVATLLSEKG
ncbi:hypothetical protein GCM10007854_29590 [Algimonas porphyrae]|uniref:Uncharacterized protein n=1 Tax=Algimonas porphyrae TaxID=1128113 RepID=A0ABQ5V5M1_9PROT|nr:hypothetical protein GCM10007854_29590 [Algimonas porphyrae]